MDDPRLKSLLCFLALCAWAALTPAIASDNAPREYAIPAGEASVALERFSEQTGDQIVYPIDALRGVRTNAVAGTFTAKEMLERMFAGTPVVVIEDQRTGALAVNRRKPGRKRSTANAEANSAAPAEDEVIKLPEFSVSSSAANRYRPTDAMSVARVRGQLLDTPLSVSVVSRDLMDDVGANSLLDVTRYFSGVSNGRGSGAGGINDRQNFRGFESYGRTIDGLSTFLIPSTSGSTSNFEPQFVERIEVVKGPDSILSPTGSSGGSMNVITKAPQFTPVHDLTVELGNYNAGKVTLDSTGPLGGGARLAYRVIADFQDAQTFVPGGLHLWNLNAQLLWKLSDTAKLTLKYFGTEWQLHGAIANPNDNGWYVVDPGGVNGATIAGTPPAGSGFTYRGWNGDTPWSRRFDRLNIVTAEYTASHFDLVSVRLAGMFIADRYNQDAGYLSAAAPAGTYDPDTGRQISLGAFDPTNLAEVAFHTVQVQHDEQLQNDYAANFRVGGVTLQPVAGWTYQQGANPSTTTSVAPLPNNNLLSGAAYDPPHPRPSEYTVAIDTASFAWQYQGYALVKAGFFDDRLFLMGGVSRLWTKSRVTDVARNSAVVLQGDKDTHLAGVLVKLTPQLALYATVSSNAALATGRVGEPVWRTGRQEEFGLKADFFHQRLALTAAHYRIGQRNLSTPNPLFNTDPVNNPVTLLSDSANRGDELELVGGLTRNLSVVASLTRMRLRDAFGRRLRNVPDSTANLLLNYRFPGGPLKNIGVFGGVQHQGDTAGETVSGFTPKGVPQQPGFRVAAWTVFNAGASYPWGRCRFNVNAENVLDKKFAWQPAGRNSVSPYPGLTLRLTVKRPF